MSAYEGFEQGNESTSNMMPLLPQLGSSSNTCKGEEEEDVEFYATQLIICCVCWISGSPSKDEGGTDGWEGVST